MKKQIKRLINSEIEKLLKIFGAICIQGPKWCGKTYLGLLFSKSHYFMNENIERNKELINEDWKRNIIFSGEKPRLIDEWQVLPQIWDKVRFIIDMNLGEPSQFILAGSNSIERTKISHSGAGRIAFINLSTLTFYEILQNESDQFISLIDLFSNSDSLPFNKTSYDLNWVCENLLIGGWPSVYSGEYDKNDLTAIAKNYVKNIANSNIEHINLNIDEKTLFEILLSIARLNGSQINNNTILKDINNKISLNTLNKYIKLLESLFIINYIDSWSINVRSKTKIRTKPKMYLCDPSLGLSILKIKGIEHLLTDTRLLGIYFENQVIKDLKVFAQTIGAELYFFRNENGFEIDAILQLDDGRWAPIEIKLTNSNKSSIDEAAKNLLSIESKIQTKIELKSKPSFYLIITASDYGYKRDDGVLVIPFTLLKP